MAIGISRSVIYNNKLKSVNVEYPNFPDIKKIVVTFSNVYLLYGNGTVTGYGTHNTYQTGLGVGTLNGYNSNLRDVNGSGKIDTNDCERVTVKQPNHWETLISQCGFGAICEFGRYSGVYKSYSLPLNFKDFDSSTTNTIFGGYSLGVTLDGKLVGCGTNHFYELGIPHNTGTNIPWGKDAYHIKSICEPATIILSQYSSPDGRAVLGLTERRNEIAIVNRGAVITFTNIEQAMGRTVNTDWVSVVTVNTITSENRGANNQLTFDSPSAVITPPYLETQPKGIAIDSNNNIFYGGDNGYIYKYDQSTQTNTVYKTGYADIEGIRIHPTNGDLYFILNKGGTASELRKISPAGVVSGKLNSTNTLYTPYGFSIHTTTVDSRGSAGFLIPDEYGLRLITSDYNTTYGSTPGLGAPNGSADGNGNTNFNPVAQFQFPRDAVSIGGMVYIADTQSNKIRKMNLSLSPYAVTTIATSLNFPSGITTDGVSKIYFTNTNSHTIQSVNSDGTGLTTVAGTNNVAGSLDGIGTAATFNKPVYITFKNNCLYVSDSLNKSIRKIDLANNKVTTIIGGPNSTTNTTGKPLTSYAYPNYDYSKHPYKNIALNSKGEIWIFGFGLNFFQRLGTASNWKYITAEYALNTNNELYRLISPSYTNSGVLTGLVYNQPQRVGTFKFKTIDKHGPWAIREDGVLFQLSGSNAIQAGTETGYADVQYSTFITEDDMYEKKVELDTYLSMNSETDNAYDLSKLDVKKPLRTIGVIKKDPSAKFVGLSSTRITTSDIYSPIDNTSSILTSPILTYNYIK